MKSLSEARDAAREQGHPVASLSYDQLIRYLLDAVAKLATREDAK